MSDRDKAGLQLIKELMETRERCAELELQVRSLGQMQAALRQTEERLELALSGAEIGLWDYNLQTGEAFISPQRAAMVGYSVEELEPHFSSWGKLVHPDDLDRVMDAFNSHVQGLTPLYQCEHRLRTKSGEYIWILARAKIVEWDKNGSPLRIVGTSLDISDRKRADEELQKAYKELARRVDERTSELVNANQRLEREIVERKQVEDALRESEGKFRSVVQTTREGICVVQDAVLKFVNLSIVKFLGHTEDELIGKRFTDFIHPDDMEGVAWRYSARLTGQKLKPRFSFRAVDKAGNVKWLEGGTAVISWEGRPAVSVFAIDISERKQMEEALRESEKRHRELIEKASDIIYLTDANGFFTLFNQVGLRLTGYSQEEIVHKHYLDLIHPDHREEVERFYGLQYIRRNPDTYYEVPIITHQGRTAWIGQSVQLVMDGETIVGFQAICRDITDRKLAEEELRKSEERLELALKGADLGLWDWNVKTAKPTWNSRAAGMLGYSPDEVPQDFRTWKRLIHPEDWPKVSDAIKAHFEGRLPYFEVECRFRCKSEEWKWILSQGKVMSFDPDGKPLRITGTSRDITNRKQMEHALRESEERYRAIFNNAVVGISLTDKEARFLQVNSRSASMLGYTPDELKAFTAFDITHPDDREFSRAHYSALAEGKVDSYRLEKRYIRKDGEVVWVDLHVSAIHNEDGKFVANLGAAVDISDRKRAEEERERMRSQLLQAQKMEAIGTLTGGIAHEFNNLLTVVSGYADLLLVDKNESDPEYPDLDRIVCAAQRGAALVRSLLTFSRKSETNLVSINLNHEVEQVKRLLDRTLPKLIEIELNLSEGLKTIEADSGQIRQILMNLALNARDAMPDGGKLTIMTKNVDQAHFPMPLGAKPGEYVQLAVSDTGIGMDKETLGRIFEPFYTTKGLAYKAGLGLAVVHGIVEQHGGCISCESISGRGATFTIYLPVAQTGEPESISVKAERLGGKETILLVDDEEYVRDLATRFLGLAGYRVISANDGLMALDLYKREKGKVSLVILDLIMPKMGGKQCLEELLKIDPGMKALVASGYTHNENKEDLIRAGAKGLVGKPFQMTELLQIIRDVLDAH
jgi:PAS domain S-box-containing protein